MVSIPPMLAPLHLAPTMIWRPGGAVTYQHGNSLEDLTEVLTPAALGTLQRQHWLRLEPPHPSLPQLPLFEEERLPNNIVAEHYEARQPAPVAVYALPGHELGGGGLLHANGFLFRKRDVLPVYYDAYLSAEGEVMAPIWTGALFGTPAGICTVGVPLAVAIHPNVVYGHFLLEMLPRLAVLSRLRRTGTRFLLALHKSIPVWAAEIVRLYFSEADIFWYDSTTTRLRCRYFIVPGMMHVDHRFPPAFNAAIDELLAHVLPHVPREGPKKIWFSRAGHDGRHGIINQAEVEAVAVSLGYTIIDPKPMSLPAQMALMAGATHIAGAYGSAMHNSIFAPRGTRVFCVNRVNWYQSGIGALRGQPVAYLPPADQHFRDAHTQNTPAAHYAVDCIAFRNKLQEFEDWKVTT